MKSDLQNLSAADFLPYQGKNVTIRFAPDAVLPAELLSVTENENYAKAARVPFSIVLRTAQKGQHYPQGIYTVEHPERGDLELFLVPIGPDAAGMRYEAVFS